MMFIQGERKNGIQMIIWLSVICWMAILNR